MRRIWITASILVLSFVGSLEGEELRFKEEFLKQLVDQVPTILKSFDPSTGRFGSGIWTCEDQHMIYPLAVAYATAGEGNPYYKSSEILSVIIKGGDLLIKEADPQGRWLFIKKDGSTWGMIWMPWTYSRWIRTFGLIAEDMPPEARQRWSTALAVGYAGISQHELKSIHNIPTHHAMGLYIAGKILDRPEWCQQASEFLHRVAAAQSDGGYWQEGGGPVVFYNFIYVGALGVYYALSRDAAVLPALERAARFHQQFTYPSGHTVETIDGRNPLSMRFPSADSNRPLTEGSNLGNVGFTFCAVGRAYLKRQWDLLGGHKRLGPDLLASFLLYGQEGIVEPEPPPSTRQISVLKEKGAARAVTLRQEPWFICLSSYTSPIVNSRWIQDRQNFVSMYHDSTGVIIGGGNTKLQPGWSTFTVGDTALLAHQPGDENPVFTPKGLLYHVPSEATLVWESDFGLDLVYGPAVCRLRIKIEDSRNLDYRLEASPCELPVAAHLTIVPRLGRELVTGSGHREKVGPNPINLPPERLQGQVTYAGFRLHLPAVASLHWPTLPHNPYRKDGHAEPEEGRIEIRIPFDQENRSYTVRIEVLSESPSP